MKDSTDSKSVKKVKNGKSGRTIDINLGDFKTHPLWALLIETARDNPLYPGNVGYAEKYILPKNPNITAKELANKLSITVGEALAILDLLHPE
ncbi:MAG: hypothetical protein ACW98U_09930 [Candidatus Thorarchaeota archaeon]|jgi:hypothetical protein